MRTPSSQKCRLDLVPPLADRFILGFPIDYGPVLLLMPFGFHLAMDTLPSGVRQAVASGRSWLYPAFAFVPVSTSPYLILSPASEAANPASWICALHLSAKRDFNPPEQRPAHRALPGCRLLAANQSTSKDARLIRSHPTSLTHTMLRLERTTCGTDVR